MRNRSNGVALFGLFELLMLCVCVTLVGRKWTSTFTSSNAHKPWSSSA
jgi:hypothetical protein